MSRVITLNFMVAVLFASVARPDDSPRGHDPCLIREGDTYILMYSGQFWGSSNYAVGYATAPSPTGPWDKFDENPILHRHAGLFGTGHHSLVPDPAGNGYLMFFHAHRSRGNTDRDTYVQRLSVSRDERGTVKLTVGE